jgi:hypothetical protein
VCCKVREQLNLQSTLGRCQISRSSKISLHGLTMIHLEGQMQLFPGAPKSFQSKWLHYLPGPQERSNPKCSKGWWLALLQWAGRDRDEGMVGCVPGWGPLCRWGSDLPRTRYSQGSPVIGSCYCFFSLVMVFGGGPAEGDLVLCRLGFWSHFWGWLVQHSG